MAISRYARTCNATGYGRDVVPNEQFWCVGCQAVKPSGYYIHDRVEMGPKGVFVCDQCLAAAKTFGRFPKVTNTQPTSK